MGDWPTARDLATTNLWKSMYPFFRQFMKSFLAYPEVEGLVILGGAGKRRFLDIHSDLDGSLFISLEIPKDLVGLDIKSFLNQ